MSKVYSSVRLFSQNILIVAAFLAIVLFIFMSAVQEASAAEITVNSFDDTIATGDGCTLREAIINANNDNQSGSTDCAAGAGADSINITIAGTINLLNNTTTPDIAGAFVSQGYNLIDYIGTAPNFTANGDQTGTFVASLDPKLTPLADNGGPTLTHALLAGSPAINTGENTNAPATDQRGFARIIGGTIDIGAYEFVPVKSRKRVRFF
jgi:CSLREA domain-containing protein